PDSESLSAAQRGGLIRPPSLGYTPRTRSICTRVGGRMHLAYTPEQEQLRHELRGYFAGLMTPELRAGLADTGDDYGDGQAYRQIVRQLGRDGWLALGWAAQHGGRG